MNFADRMMLEALASEFREAFAALVEEMRRRRESVAALSRARSAAERALMDALDAIYAADPTTERDEELQAWMRENWPYPLPR